MTLLICLLTCLVCFSIILTVLSLGDFGTFRDAVTILNGKEILNKKTVIGYLLTHYNVLDMSFIFIISPILIFVLLYYSLTETYIKYKDIKIVDNLGYNGRTIYGYKGRVYVCTGSGDFGEDPDEVIKRIRKKYAVESNMKKQYIEAVKYVTGTK